ncbi:uncharacterized protein LOC142497360 isoform X3 [Ascaphus truei]|uniref:uncharacterized protein LOC142497360 isoform X3 n=1 Tax=Ascaphus truei TaxID=8439 RepID=UPI003F5A81E4
MKEPSLSSLAADDIFMALWNLGCCHRDIKIKPRQLQLASERRQTSGCIKQIMMDPTTLGSSEHTSCGTDIIKNREGTTMDEDYGQHGKEGRLGVGETMGLIPEMAPVVTSSYETAHNIDLQLEIQTTSTHEDYPVKIIEEKQTSDDIFEQNRTSQEEDSLTEQKRGLSMEDMNVESMRNDNVEELEKIEHTVDFKGLETGSSEEVPTNKEAQITCCPPNDTDSIADTIGFVVPGEGCFEKPLVPTSREDHCYSYAMGGLDPDLKQKKRIHRVKKAVNDRFTDTVEVSDLQPSTRKVLPIIFQEEAKDDGSDCDKTSKVSHLRMSQHSCTDTFYKGLLLKDDIFEQNTISQEDESLTEQKMGHSMENVNVKSTRDDNVEELKQIEQKVNLKGLENESSKEVPTNEETQITCCPPNDTDSIADTIGFIVSGEWGVEKPLVPTSREDHCYSYVMGGLDTDLKQKKRIHRVKKAVNDRFTDNVEASDLQPSTKDVLPMIFQEEAKDDGRVSQLRRSQRSCKGARYKALLSEGMLTSLRNDNKTDGIFKRNKISQEEDSLVEQKMGHSMEDMNVESTRDDNVEEVKQIQQKVDFKGLETGSSEDVPTNKNAQITYCPPRDTDSIADTIEFVIKGEWGVEKPLVPTSKKDQCCPGERGGSGPNRKEKKRRQRVKKAVNNRFTDNVEASDLQPSRKEVIPMIFQEEANDDGSDGDKTEKVLQSQRSCTDVFYNALLSEPMLASLHDDNNTDDIFEQNKTSQEGDSLTEQKMGHSMENMNVESTRDDNVEELKQIEQKVDFKGLETGSSEDVPTNEEAQITCCPPMDTNSIADTIEFVIKGEWGVEKPLVPTSKKDQFCPGEMGGSGPNRKEKKRRQRVKKAVNNRFTDNIEASDLQPSRTEVIPMIFQEDANDDGSVGDKTTKVLKSQRSCKGAHYKALLSEGMLTSLHNDNKTGKHNSKRLRSSVDQNCWEKDTWETVLGGPGLNRKIKSHEDVAPGLAQLEEKCDSNHHTEQCSVISEQEDLAILKRKKAKYNGSVQEQQSKRAGSQAQNAKRSNKKKGSVQNRSYGNESNSNNNNNKTMERDVRNADVDFWNMPALWVLPRWTSACLRIDPQREAESGYEAAERAGQRAFLEHAEAARGRRGTELRSYRKRSTSQCALSIRLTKLRRLEKQPPTPLPEHFYCPVTFQRQHISALKLHDVTCHLPAEDLMHCSYKDFRERMLGIYSGNASETPVLHIIPAEEDHTSTENQSLDRSTS